MRLACPFCGERDNDEFVYLGSADPVRPEPDAPAEAWTDYVYQRTNTAGRNRELWHHTYGCREWLVVERDTRTHEIISAEPSRTGPEDRA